MVSSFGWRRARAFDFFPLLIFQIVAEKIVVIIARLLLIPSEEIQEIVVGQCDAFAPDLGKGGWPFGGIKVH